MKRKDGIQFIEWPHFIWSNVVNFLRPDTQKEKEMNGGDPLSMYFLFLFSFPVLYTFRNFLFAHVEPCINDQEVCVFFPRIDSRFHQV